MGRLPPAVLLSSQVSGRRAGFGRLRLPSGLALLPRRAHGLPQGPPAPPPPPRCQRLASCARAPLIVAPGPRSPVEAVTFVIARRRRRRACRRHRRRSSPPPPVVAARRRRRHCRRRYQVGVVVAFIARHHLVGWPCNAARRPRATAADPPRAALAERMVDAHVALRAHRCQKGSPIGCIEVTGTSGGGPSASRSGRQRRRSGAEARGLGTRDCARWMGIATSRQVTSVSAPTALVSSNYMCSANTMS